MIKAMHLAKRYGRKQAVDDLSFEVKPGVVTGFLGPNGAGKSTTMRLMLGLDHGGGQTLFDGVAYHQLKHPMRDVGVVLEARAFHPARRARNHLRMLAAAGGIPRRRVDEVLEWVGLHSVARKRPKGYSLGMAQRLGLAAAMLGDPDTLILDEPANGLDPAGVHWLRGFLKSFAAEGRTVFVSSHLLAEMSLMADHLVVIGKGRLIADEPTEEFLRRSSNGAVLVRTPHVERLAQALAAEGAAVVREDATTLAVTGVEQAHIGEVAFQNRVLLHELAPRTATLEDAFLEATGAAEEFRAQTLADSAEFRVLSRKEAEAYEAARRAESFFPETRAAEKASYDEPSLDEPSLDEEDDGPRTAPQPIVEDVEPAAVGTLRREGDEE